MKKNQKKVLKNSRLLLFKLDFKRNASFLTFFQKFFEKKNFLKNSKK